MNMETLKLFSRDALDREDAIDREAETRRRASVFAFSAAWLFVGLVSAYDAFLIVKFQHLVHDFEMNPIGRWMMDLEYLQPIPDTNGVAAFLGCKFAGTIIALGVMMLVYWRNERMGLTVVGALVVFQASLAAFLTLGY